MATPAPDAPPTLAARLRRKVGTSGWNLAVTSSADVVSKGLAVAYGAVLARALGTTGFGTYSTVMAFVALALAVGNLGIDRFLYRELSHGMEPLRLYATARAVRWVVVPLVAALMAGYAVATGNNVWPWLLGALALVPALETSLLSVLFQAQERFSVTARASTLHVVVTCGYVFALAAVGAPLWGYLAGYVVAEGVRLGYLRYQARHVEWPASAIRWAELGGMLRSAAPYAILTVLGVIYLRIDLIMLDAMRGGGEVGVYAGSTRVLFVASALPGLCLGVLFPRFVRLQREDPVGSSRLFLLANRVMIWAGLAVAGTLALGARPILLALYGPEYAEGAGALRLLMLALLAMFWHASNGTVLFSSERLRSVVVISFFTAGFNVAANLYAIPRWGGEGAAATTAMSEVLSFALFTPIVCRRLGVGFVAYLRSAVTPYLSRADRHELLGIPS